MCPDAERDTTPIERRKWPWIAFALSLLLVAVAGYVVLRDRDSAAIPDEVVQDPRGVVADLHNNRYCEVLLAKGPLISLHAAVYNTIDLNDCPAGQ